MCTRVCVSLKGENANAERERKKREGGEKKKREKKRTTRAYPCTRAHSRALASTRKRRAAADFAFCSRCFLCVLLPLFFSTLSTSPPPRPRPTYTSPPPLSRLTCTGKKKPCIFCPPFFLHDTAICRPARFLRPFSPGLFTRRYLRCKSKRGPFPLTFFLWRNPAPSD